MFTVLMDMELEVRLGWYEISFYGTRTSSFKYRYEILFYRTFPESLMSHMQFILYWYGTLFYGNIVPDGSHIETLVTIHRTSKGCELHFFLTVF